MNFTFSNYTSTLKKIITKDFVTYTAKDFAKNCQNISSSESCLILRHDCERDLDKACKMAKIENNLSIKSTYFIRMHSEFYNLNSYETVKKVKFIESLGMEIGLHYEPKFYSLMNWSLSEGLKKDISFFNNLLDNNVRSISPHQPLLNSPNIKEIKNLGLIDMRLNPIFKNVKYLSDSGMQYRELSLYDAIDKYKILQFLIHPDFWNFKKGINWKTNLNNLNIVKKEELDNLIKKEIIMYDNYILNRNQMDRDFLKDENSTS